MMYSFYGFLDVFWKTLAEFFLEAPLWWNLRLGESNNFFS